MNQALAKMRLKGAVPVEEVTGIPSSYLCAPSATMMMQLHETLESFGIEVKEEATLEMGSLNAAQRTQWVKQMAVFISSILLDVEGNNMLSVAEAEQLPHTVLEQLMDKAPLKKS